MTNIAVSDSSDILAINDMTEQDRDECVPVTAIRIDLSDLSITFEADKKPIAKLGLSAGTIYFQIPSLSPSAARITAGGDEGDSESPAEDSAPSEATKEKERSVVFSGRLKSRPRQGKPDSQGHPTAWARLAVHEEGRDDAHMFSATFHRGSARIALNLPVDAQVRVEGYPHPSNDPEGKRLDTLSVFRFLSAPTKQESGEG